MPDDAVLDGLVSHTLQDFTDNTVTKLGNYAFYGNNNLVNVSLPALTNCGNNVFQECTALTNAAFSALETMGMSMFIYCNNLVNVSLPALQDTAASGFQGCGNLEEMDFPSTVKTLRGSLFSMCSKLSRITASGVTTTEGTVFSECISLEAVNFPNATLIGESAFVGCSTLASVSLPAVAEVRSNAFRNCSSLGVVELPNCTKIGTNLGNQNGPTGFDFTKKITIPANAFANSGNMQHLILRANEVCPLSNVSAFTGTPISIECGYIYVPSDLVAAYKAATNWSTYADRIVAISEYPKAATGTISDSWATILANPNYATDYHIGDTKILDIDGSPVLMQIAAFDTDVLSAGGGTAGITWISKGFLEKRQMNASSTVAGGWADTAMRDYLRNTLYPKIDSTVRAGIKEVNKTYRGKSPSDTTSTIADTVWIPSCKEVGFSNANTVEASGVVYSSLFTDKNSRIKGMGAYGLGSADYWWLRSARSSSDFVGVSSGGTEGGVSASLSFGLALGFCTN